jgi:hypothetical protein
MPAVVITDELIADLKRGFLYDSEVIGFHVRWQLWGAAYVLIRRIGGVSRRLTLGPVAAYDSVEAARDVARRLISGALTVLPTFVRDRVTGVYTPTAGKRGTWNEPALVVVTKPTNDEQAIQSQRLREKHCPQIARSAKLKAKWRDDPVYRERMLASLHRRFRQNAATMAASSPVAASAGSDAR